MAWFIDPFYLNSFSSSSPSFLLESRTYKHRSVVVGSSPKPLLRTLLLIHCPARIWYVLVFGIVALQFKPTTERFVVFRWWMAGGVLRPFNSNKLCTLRLHTQNEKKPHCFVYYVHIIITNNNKRRRQTSERNEQLQRWIEQKVRWLQGIPLKYKWRDASLHSVTYSIFVQFMSSISIVIRTTIVFKVSPDDPDHINQMKIRKESASLYFFLFRFLLRWTFFFPISIKFTPNNGSLFGRNREKRCNWCGTYISMLAMNDERWTMGNRRWR